MTKVKKMFNYGDKVLVNNYPGVINSIYLDSAGHRIAMVVFDDSRLIPPYMEIEECYLSPYNEKHTTDTQCPICHTAWHTTKFNNHIWHDCLLCKKTKEDILKLC